MPRNSSAKVINYNNPSSVTRGRLQTTRQKSGSGSSSSSSSAKQSNNPFVSNILKGSLQNFVNAYRDVAEAEKARNEALKMIVKIDDYFNPSTSQKSEMSEGLKNYNNNVSDLIKAIREGASSTNNNAQKAEMSNGLKNTVNNTNTLIGAIRDGIFSPRGVNSMLADQRRNQVMQILNGKNLAMPIATTNTPAATEETSAEDVVEYTYKPGDTFGQVIKNLGLQTDNGLWGPNGDVAYYTQQLAEQGAMNSRGNIPIGTTIRLVRRK